MTRMAHACMPLDTHKLNYARRLLDTLPRDIAGIADNFYPDANDLAREWAHQSGYSVEQCCAVLALYSINTNWRANVQLARNALLHGRIVGIPIARENVRAILSGASVEAHLTQGLKVNAFYRAISGDTSACVIDRWMYRALCIQNANESWYMYAVRACSMLLPGYDLAMTQLQARLWYAVILDYAAEGDRGGIQSVAMIGLRDHVDAA